MIETLPFVLEPIHLKDFAIGAFAALALRRSRIETVMNRVLPGEQGSDADTGNGK